MKNFDYGARNEFFSIPEYSYEDGLNHCLSVIMKRLQEHPYVVIGIVGSTTYVGKTKLARDIIADLSDKGIRTKLAHVPDELHFMPHEKKQEKMVFIIDQIDWGSLDIAIYEKHKRYLNDSVIEACANLGCSVDGVDLWVGIYRPDKPFGDRMTSGNPARPIADILINNTAATKPAP